MLKPIRYFSCILKQIKSFIYPLKNVFCLVNNFGDKTQGPTGAGKGLSDRAIKHRKFLKFNVNLWFINMSTP